MCNKEFREQAVKQVTKEGLSTKKSAQRLLLPPSILTNWLKVAQIGKLGEIGKTQRIPSHLSFISIRMTTDYPPHSQMPVDY